MKNVYDTVQVDYSQLAEFFKVLGEPTRLQLLFLLSDREICVSELTGYLNASQSTVSHQLNILKAHKLIRRRREGKQIYYSVSDCQVSLVTKLGIEIVTARK